jgi:hypothetical protein
MVYNKLSEYLKLQLENEFSKTIIHMERVED